MFMLVIYSPFMLYN